MRINSANTKTKHSHKVFVKYKNAPKNRATTLINGAKTLIPTAITSFSTRVQWAIGAPRGALRLVSGEKSGFERDNSPS